MWNQISHRICSESSKNKHVTRQITQQLSRASFATQKPTIKSGNPNTSTAHNRQPSQTRPNPPTKLGSRPILNPYANNKAYGSWQERSVTLREQRFKIPDLILRKIEGISGARIRQTAEEFTPPSNEGMGMTSLSSDFQSHWYSVEIIGDANAVENAMDQYYLYVQSAVPMVIGTAIPEHILERISADCQCFIESQSSVVIRLFPRQPSNDINDNQASQQLLARIQQKIRDSIHSIDIPGKWANDGYLLLHLKNVFKQYQLDIEWKTGGTIWINEPTFNDESPKKSMIVDRNQQKIWMYQNPDLITPSVPTIRSVVSEMMDRFTEGCCQVKISSAQEALLSARKHTLWNYIKDTMLKDHAIHVFLSQRLILGLEKKAMSNLMEDRLMGTFLEASPSMDDESKDSESSDEVATVESSEMDPIQDFFRRLWKKTEIIELDLNKQMLSERQYDEIKQILISNKMLYTFPDRDSAYVAQNNNQTLIAYYCSNTAKRTAISNKIRHILQLESQSIHVRSEERFKLTSRILNQKRRDIGSPFKIDYKNQFVLLSGNVTKETRQSIYNIVSDISGVTLPVPHTLLFLRSPSRLQSSERSQKGFRPFIDDIEKEFNAYVTMPSFTDIPSIVEQSTKSGIRNPHIRVHFWSENRNDIQRLEDYFKHIRYDCVDLPVPLALLTSNNRQELHMAIEEWREKYGIMDCVDHPKGWWNNTTLQSRSNLLYPPPYHYRYWIFSNNRNSSNTSKLLDSIQSSVKNLDRIEVGNMAPLLHNVKLLDGYRKRHRSEYMKLLKSSNDASDIAPQTHFHLSLSDSNIYASQPLTTEDRRSLNDEIAKFTAQTKQINLGKYKVIFASIAAQMSNLQSMVRNSSEKNGFLWFTNETMDDAFVFGSERLQNQIASHIGETIDNSRVIHFGNDIFDGSNYSKESFFQLRKNDKIQDQLRKIRQQTGVSMGMSGSHRTLGLYHSDKNQLQTAHNMVLETLKFFDDSTLKMKPIVNVQ